MGKVSRPSVLALILASLAHATLSDKSDMESYLFVRRLGGVLGKEIGFDDPEAPVRATDIHASLGPHSQDQVSWACT